jgi:hypothetical protein
LPKRLLLVVLSPPQVLPRCNNSLCSRHITCYRLPFLLNRKCTCYFYTTAGPATLRITSGRRLFQPGAFKLGWWAYPLGIVSTCWWIFSLVVFSLPTEYPVTGDNFNSAPVTLGATLLLASLWYWVPGIGAKKRFNGPSFDVVAFERQLLLGEVEEGAAEYDKNVPRQPLQ